MKQWLLIAALVLILAALTVFTFLTYRSAAHPASTAIAGSTASGGGTQVWFKPMETRPDYVDVFSTTNDEWPISRAGASGMMLNIGTIQDELAKDPAYITGTLGPFFKANPNIKLVLETTAPTFASCLGDTQRQRLWGRDVSTIQQLQQAGITISYLHVESSLSKGPNDGKNQCATSYLLPDRINDIVAYLENIKASPMIDTSNLKFSLTDASLSKGDAWISANLGVPTVYDEYDQILSAFQKANLTLSFVMLDIQWDDISDLIGSDSAAARNHSTSIANIKAFEAYLTGKGIESGNDLSTNSATSDADYDSKILQTTKALAEAGTAGDVHVVISFGTPYPAMNLPENPSDPTSYPLARVLKDVEAYFKQP